MGLINSFPMVCPPQAKTASSTAKKALKNWNFPGPKDWRGFCPKDCKNRDKGKIRIEWGDKGGKNRAGGLGDKSPQAWGPGGAQELPLIKLRSGFHLFGGRCGGHSPPQRGQRRAEGSERGGGFPLRIN